MKRVLALLSLVVVLTSPLANGDVVMDLVTKDAGGNTTESSRFYVQEGKVRVDDVGGQPGDRVSIIYLGDQFIVLDHRHKTYTVMDQATLDEVGTQISAAMQEMQQQLASMPPEQRAMVEQMMKGDMRNMLPGAAPAPPAPRVEANGTGQWQEYSCVIYSVYEGAEKTEELCASPLDDIDGASELMSALRGMAAYMEKVIESNPVPVAPATAANPVALMDQIEGFPVRAVRYANGSISEETTLEAVSEQDVSEDLFIVPADYRREDLFDRP